MRALIGCKFDDDLMKTGHARLETQFFPLCLWQKKSALNGKLLPSKKSDPV